ncbi:hypothetical protein ATANTOWER_010340 [Ataeniobius toweri]|uniref:Uncharacterized protein n=1 Tax=Ataeniobius toweri TaxID=208326 RepID=A0ABU7AFC9_9TELE|nr:hypothetical protein [Ataeniobius toweri]
MLSCFDLLCKCAELPSADAISKVRVHVFVRLIPSQPGGISWTFKVFPFKATAVWASPDYAFVPVLLLEVSTEFYYSLFEIWDNQLLVAAVYQLIVRICHFGFCVCLLFQLGVSVPLV